MAGPSMLMLDCFSVLMCKVCKTILAEARNACDCDEQLNVIACLSATSKVEQQPSVRCDVSEDLQGCVFRYLECKTCKAKVGMFLTCTIPELAHLRQLYCFLKKSILCYSMKTKQLVEGDRFYLTTSSCVKQLKDLQQELFDTHKRIQELADKARSVLHLTFSEENEG